MTDVEGTARMGALEPLTLAERIPTITEAIAAEMNGPRKIKHPTKGHEIYRFSAKYVVDGEGEYIDLEVSEYGPHADMTRVFIHVSPPVERRGPAHALRDETNA